jgi:cytoplasmic iron level regulating protein YaaA (DUF328/UPF0246 family)
MLPNFFNKKNEPVKRRTKIKSVCNERNAKIHSENALKIKVKVARIVILNKIDFNTSKINLESFLINPHKSKEKTNKKASGK